MAQAQDSSTSASTTAAPSPQPQPPAPEGASAADSSAAAPAAAAAPSPLDGLSPTDLRIKLDAARKDLRGHLEKKRRLDRDLAQLEQQIYAFEGSYLSDSLFPPGTAAAAANPGSSQAAAAAAAAAAANQGAQFGNIIRGYDSYLKAPSASAQDRKRVRPGDPPSEKERMFSASSATFHRVSRRAAFLDPETFVES